ncbi:von Willebrand factor type A domain containing protein [Tritrichomonas foetus]|uniref:von Willebrand factor type A domain containing protein n=1 Tax=Tritrichomonas foetus TaxID=1144522 RepID=A0A1J4KS64_9EUKA|nr:von Willebrand factor type A domain containing protein [Tritrichomonas foetus]|eukprot:OHT14129.1 von Willebrand factor type A domain containing protein [Tritrichomonas foetus]
MVFGSCCILVDNKFKSMTAKAMRISGTQRNLIARFDVEQVFEHSEAEPKEVSYVFPNDMKICIYDTTFIVGTEVIKPKLQSKETAKATYDEAVEKGHTAVFGTNIGHGLTEFKLGNLPANTECKVQLKIAFSCQLTTSSSMFLKFPLDVYSPNGSKHCIDSTNFSLSLNCDKSQISKVSCNIPSTFSEDNCSITIDKSENATSAIFTMELKDKLQNSAFSIGKDCVLVISPDLEIPETKNNEFIFIIDCSGSMSGSSIQQARECLEIFIRSLPENSYFNIIRFGSRFQSLFESSVQYNEETAEKALELAQNMKADLGGTNIYSPLESAFKNARKSNLQRQFFIMTDGEVHNVSEILNLVTEHSKENRCYTIGIGRGADAGLVEGIATSSGGKCDFVGNSESLSNKVIPQLESSLLPSFINVEIHVEGNDNIEISPFPIPSINPKGATTVFIHSQDSDIQGNVLINGSYGDGNEEIIISIDEGNENSYNEIKDAILPLYSFHQLQKYERMRNISDQDKEKAISLSISSGVLCNYTAYVGVSKEPVADPNVHRMMRFGGGRIAAPGGYMEHAVARCARAQVKCCAAPMACKAAPRKLEDSVECCAAPMALMGSRASNPKGGMLSKFGKASHVKECMMQEEECCEAPMPVMKRLASKEKADSNPQSNYDKYELMTLIKLQKISGYWQDLDAINQLSKLHVKSLNDLNLTEPLNTEVTQAIKDASDSNPIICTLIALALLHKFSNDVKNSWMMLETKALKWLSGKLENVDIQAVIAHVESIIPPQ